MNKYITLSLAVCIIVATSCSEKKKPAYERNNAIDRSNSYSSLFMDSATLEDFITQQKLNDTISHDMRVFYNARNFQFAWFSGDGLTEQSFAFRSLYDHSKKEKEKRPLDYKLDNIMLNDSLRSLRANRNLTKTELLFTWRFIQYLWNNHENSKMRKEMLTNFVPAQKFGFIERAEMVLKEDDHASNPAYQLLRKQLKTYLDICREGGWTPIPEKKKKLKPGKSDEVITAVKKRLQLTGQYNTKDTSPVYSADLEKSVKQVQNSYGFTPNGIIDVTLIKELNEPVSARLQQILINMERVRWQPDEPKGERITVNIPEFMLHVWNGKQKEFSMEVIVGKQGNSTIMFAGFLEQLVFSPYWNVPESIVREEIMPAFEEDPAYLIRNDMEMVSEVNGVPVIRQLPGEDNALGKVKFLFPNSFNIYFHDTPDKSLFKRQQRAYSHGCIRLADGEKLANYLLKDDKQWPEERIRTAMNSGKEKFVKVDDPVPVVIEYLTAWVDENDNLQFRNDIYGHDRKMARKLFTSSSLRS